MPFNFCNKILDIFGYINENDVVIIGERESTEMVFFLLRLKITKDSIEIK